MKRSTSITLIVLVLAHLTAIGVSAAITVSLPHYDEASGFVCATCHMSHLTIDNTSTSYNNICLSCHRSGDPAAGNKPISLADAANPFGTHPSNGISRVYQTSHRWDGSDTNLAAGTQPPVQGQMTSNGLRGRTGGQLACVRCHNQHDNANGSFLRMANNQDQMCLDCHRLRNVLSHTQGSHPVGVDYAQKAAANPTGFNATPLNANPANPSSALKLLSGKIFCSTCHGVHATDSRSGTIDGSANFANLSTGDGYVLRTARRGAKVAANSADALNLCANCHAGKKNHNLHGQDVQCADCHGAHVEFDAAAVGAETAPNVYLVRRYLQYSTAGRLSKRIIYNSTTAKNFYSATGGGVCQSCHTPPASHFSGSTSIEPGHSACTGCHSHNDASGSFSVGAGGCTSCHGYPPSTNTSGGPTGAAAGYTRKVESATPHAYHASTPYAFACTQCHNGNSHNTGTSSDVFIVKTGVLAGTAATYTSATFTCSTVYCHSAGQGAGGVTLAAGDFTAPTWSSATFTCGSCHKDMKTSTTATGSHVQHAQSAAVACAACHAGYTDTSVDHVKHVNGQIDLTFGGSGAGTIYSQGLSHAPGNSYGSCSATICHGSGSPVWGVASAKPQCEKCHGSENSTLFYSTGGVTTNTNAKAGVHTAHLQATQGISLKIACSECHTVPATINGPNHMNGTSEVPMGGVLVKSRSVIPVYTAATRSCSNTYCHGASSATIGGSNTTPAWNVPLFTGSAAHDCSLCHGYPPATSIHTGKGPTSCLGCHSHVNSAGTGFSDISKHLNGIIEATGVHDVPYYTHYITSNASCSSCHNVSSSGSYPAAVADNPPNCRGCHIAADPTVASSGCISCHAVPPNGSTSPNTSGSHARHAVTSADCNTCHNGFGSGKGVLHGPSNRGTVPSVVNVAFNAATAGIGATWSSTGKSCSATLCHGQGSPTWGATSAAQVNGFPYSATQCDKCHSGTATAPFYSTAIPKVTANTNAKVGAHTSHLTAPDVLTNTFACADCHGTVTLTSATHMNGTTNFSWSSLATKSGTLTPTYTAGTGVCSNVYCHGASMPGGDTTGTNRAPTWNVAFLPATLTAAGCGSCHGFPPSSASGHPTGITIPVGFPTTASIGTTCSCHSNINASGNSYATIFVNRALHINGILETPLGGHSFPYSGSLHLSAAGTTPWSSCTGCHSNTAGGTYPVASGTAPNCTGCHLQTLRVPSGTSSCWDCHGVSATDGLPNGTVFPNNNRSHSAHTSIAGTGCVICHTGGGTTTATHGSSNRAAATQASVKVTFSAQAGPSAAWTPGTITCSTTYCHGQGTVVWGTPLWSTTDQCGKCHSSTTVGAVTAGVPFYNTAYPTKVTANTDAKVGAHTNHMTSQTLGISASTACSDCHGTATLTGVTHMNGSTTFAWSVLATRNGVLAPTYTATTRACTNTYCHGNAMPGGDTTGTDKSPTWTNSAYLPAAISAAACGTCHGFPPATASGHPAVSIPAGFPTTATIGTTCSCHSNINSAGNSYANMFVNPAFHINGTLETPSGAHAVPFSGSLHMSVAGTSPWSNCISCHSTALGGAYPAAPTFTPGCTGCHIQGLKAPSGTSSCWDCHGASATNGLPNGTTFPNIAGSHAVHAAITGSTCNTCHSGGGTTAVTHGSSNRTVATAASVTVSFTSQGAAPLWTFASNTCSATNCHGQGSPTWGATSAVQVNGFPYSATQCDKCHSGTATAPFYSTAIPKVTANTNAKVGAHTSHLTAPDVLTNTFACADCHGTVTLTSATHMNGTTNFSWSSLATKSGTLTPTYTAGTGVCSNVYCHGASMPGGDTTGTNRAPTWSVSFLSATLSRAACASCHGFPPSSASGHPAVTIPASWPVSGATTGSLGTTCSCHANISSTGTTYASIFVDKSLHIDGTVQVSGGHDVPYLNHNAVASSSCLSANGGCHSTGSAASSYPAAIGDPPHCMSCHVRADPLLSGNGLDNCKSCHGTGGTGTAAAPAGTTWPNIRGTNGDARHPSHEGSRCGTCHPNVGDTGRFTGTIAGGTVASGSGAGVNHGPNKTMTSGTSQTNVIKTTAGIVPKTPRGSGATCTHGSLAVTGCHEGPGTKTW